MNDDNLDLLVFEPDEPEAQQSPDEHAFMLNTLIDLNALLQNIDQGRVGFTDGMNLLVQKAIEAQQTLTGDVLVNSYMRVEQMRRMIEDMIVGKRPPTISTGIEPLDAFLGGGLRPGAVYIVAGRPGTGKCLSPRTTVMMADGALKQARYVRVGDRVMGPDGGPRRVLSTTTGEDEMFRIVPIKGEPWECNSQHVLSLVRNRTGRSGEIIDVPLDEYLNPDVPLDRGKLKLFRVGVEFPERETLIAPYLAGLWLGDGTKDRPEITNKEPVVAAYCRAVAGDYGCTCSVTPLPANNSQSIKFQREDRKRGSGHNAIALGFEGLVQEDGQKRIAPPYLVNSRQKRLELLAGLLDTDGYVSKVCVEISTKYDGLKDDLLYLCRSLGLAAYATYKKSAIKDLEFEGWYWRIYISGDVNMIPCKVLRLTPRQQVKNALRTGFSVEPLGRGPYCGFMLDGDGRFLLGDFTVTHNSVLKLQIAEHAASFGKKVLYVSIEMDVAQLSWRTLSRLTGMSQSGFDQNPEFWPMEHVDVALKDMGGWPIMFKDSGLMNTSACMAAARTAIKEMGGLDLLVIDYLHILTDGYGGGNENARIGYISRTIRGIARDLEVPVLVGAQLNRSNDREKRKPTLKDLRDSGTLESDASIVLAIHPHYDAEAEGDKPPVLQTDLILLKNRFGRAGVHVPCNFDQPRQLFKLFDSEDHKRYDASGIAYDDLKLIPWDEPGE